MPMRDDATDAGEPQVIRVVVADDHPIVRAGLLAVLAPIADIDVVGTASTAAEAVAAAPGADLVLMDLSFGDGPTGIDATREIASLSGGPSVLVLTNYDSDADILGAIEAGAAGYLLKDAAPEDLIDGIRSAAGGNSVLGPAVATRLVARVSAPQQALSAREIEVLARAAEGLTNLEIAGRLHVGETTVKSHLAHIYTKLDVSNRSAAIAAAQRAGLFRTR